MSIREIAKLAGLSPSAVSLALRGSPKIPAATRKRVSALAAQLGYTPNPKVHELMSQLRLNRKGEATACFGVISLYNDPQPWKQTEHFTRIYESMERRAAFFGYRLEPIWLLEPRMTPQRICEILDARNIQGLLCFGAPELGQELPPELDHYAIVTQGLSIKTPLHRVVSHVYNDMWRALEAIYELGYRRPGLVIGHYEEVRSAHAYTCAYLGWCQHVIGTPTAIPVLELEQVEEKPFTTWLGRHRPDVVIFVHHYNVLDEFDKMLGRSGIQVPEDFGVLVVSQILPGKRFSGLQENQHLIGAWCVELLVSRIMSGDFGFPSHPRIEMVERQWIDGRSLRRQDR